MEQGQLRYFADPSDLPHGAKLLSLDNERDAALAMQVAQQYTRLCLIGLGNLRSPYDRYVFEYWLP